MMTIFRTTRLTLALCTPEDRNDFMDLERDADVMLYLNGGVAVDQNIADPNSLFLMPRGTEKYIWTARRSSDAAFVGWFCLWPDDPKTAELGYRLRRDSWGQGFATEGAKALVRWGFETAGYDIIKACTMTSNLGSRRVLEKTGFKLARTVLVDWAGAIPGGELGEVQYELTL